MTTHPTIDNVTAITMADGTHRVTAVEWGQHDVLTCDGQDLDINTDGFMWCPVSGCNWMFDPDFSCPEIHVQS